MKGLNYSLMRIICALIIGLLLVLFPAQAGEYFVLTLGVVFMVPSLIGLISYLVQKPENRRRFPIEAVGSLLFGLFLGFFPGYFIAYLMFLLGGLLVLAGINQLWNTVKLRKVLPFNWWSFLLSLVFMAIGIIVIFKPMETASLPFILLGCSMIIYGITELINGIRWRKYKKNEITVMYEE